MISSQQEGAPKGWWAGEAQGRGHGGDQRILGYFPRYFPKNDRMSSRNADTFPVHHDTDPYPIAKYPILAAQTRAPSTSSLAFTNMSTTDTLSATLSAVATAVTTVATATATVSAEEAKKNVTDKVIGVCLALGSGVLIGSRYVLIQHSPQSLRLGNLIPRTLPHVKLRYQEKGPNRRDVEERERCGRGSCVFAELVVVVGNDDDDCWRDLQLCGFW